MSYCIRAKVILHLTLACRVICRFIFQSINHLFFLLSPVFIHQNYVVIKEEEWAARLCERFVKCFVRQTVKVNASDLKATGSGAHTTEPVNIGVLPVNGLEVVDSEVHLLQARLLEEGVGDDLLDLVVVEAERLDAVGHAVGAQDPDAVEARLNRGKG